MKVPYTRYTSPFHLTGALSLPLSALLTFGVIGGLSALSGCGAPSIEAKRALGLRARVIELRDVSPAHLAFARTSLDLFNNTPQGKRALGQAPLLVRYHSYQQPELDEILRKGSALYARLSFDLLALERFTQALGACFGEGGTSLNSGELGAQIAVLKERDSEALDQLRTSYQAIRLSVESAQKLVSEARTSLTWVKENSNKALDQLPPALKSDAQDDLARLTERLHAVERGTPELAASLGALKATLASLSMLL